MTFRLLCVWLLLSTCMPERTAALSQKDLFDRGATRVYSGANLGAISIPVGGIGAGSIQMDGKARLAIWQIHNNYTQAVVPGSFFAIRARRDGGRPVLRALQTEQVGPFPAMKRLTFRGEYPFAWYDYEDPALPVEVTLEAFSPMIPLDARDSAIPCAIFSFTVGNPGPDAVEVSLLASQQNAVGFTGDRPIDDLNYGGYGGNRTRLIKSGDTTVLHMTADQPKNSPGYGDMALVAVFKAAIGASSWADVRALAQEFRRTGAISGPDAAGPSPSGQTINGALSVPMKLGPGQKKTVKFILTWYFPNAHYGEQGWGADGNNYTNWWPSAFHVADEVTKRLDELTSRTKLYHDTLYESNLPHWLLDRVTSQLAILRTRTCFWARNGYFGGWEGCGNASGCCLGNCNHVWHYAQGHARLFPEIGRLMREQELDHQLPSGGIQHRQAPEMIPVFDGQCGTVLGAYREHLLSSDRSWLDRHWPRVRRAMDYLISTWDVDEDGVLAGEQYNTLDSALGGSSSWLGSLYLAALAASERMALVENDPSYAERCKRIRESGSAKQDATLFNGEYYIQIPDPEPRRDYNMGCHIDQVLGQWWAHQLDLGDLYPPTHVRSALEAIRKHNFRSSFQGVAQSPRKFVADEDAGTQMITWPKGGRPAPEHQILYGDEVMTGFEYSAAAAMIQMGMLEDGLRTARAVYDRYDGRLRTGLTGGDTASWGYSGNPFGDDECGKFYARAMSVWSLLLACQGFIYDGPAGVIGFKPVWKPEDHVSFFTAAEGYGLFRQYRQAGMQTNRIEIRQGRLPAKTIILQVPAGVKLNSVSVEKSGEMIKATFTELDGSLRIDLGAGTSVQENETLVVTIAL